MARRGQRWTLAEDQILTEEVKNLEGKESFGELEKFAKAHKRSSYAIWLRLLLLAAQLISENCSLAEAATKYKLPEADLLRFQHENFTKVKNVAPPLLPGCRYLGKAIVSKDSQHTSDSLSGHEASLYYGAALLASIEWKKKNLV